MSAKWRKRIFVQDLIYVPQKSVLFSGTIDSNLRYGGCTDASEEEIRKAAEIAQASEFIEEKDENMIRRSQGGTNVSGGQKQRLSIARAIAKTGDPDF